MAAWTEFHHKWGRLSGEEKAGLAAKEKLCHDCRSTTKAQKAQNMMGLSSEILRGCLCVPCECDAVGSAFDQRSSSDLSFFRDASRKL